MSLADDLNAARMKHHVSFETTGTTFASLASLCKDSNKVQEIYEMAAIAVHIQAFAGTVEELAIKACALILVNNLQATQGAHYAVAQAIKFDCQYPTELVCTLLLRIV